MVKFASLRVILAMVTKMDLDLVMMKVETTIFFIENQKKRSSWIKSRDLNMKITKIRFTNISVQFYELKLLPKT